jgi:hypothetical protein
MRPAGGGDEFLLLNLVDDSDGEQTIANADCTLPPPEQVLGQTGLTVDEFLARWRQGERYLEPAARQYGRLLYRHLLLDPPEVREAWNEALRQASGRGLRLEIRLPRPGAALWREQSVLMLPFELLCDDSGFLFRRSGLVYAAASRTDALAAASPRCRGAAAARRPGGLGQCRVR